MKVNGGKIWENYITWAWKVTKPVTRCN
jgi:hypothetical protein